MKEDLTEKLEIVKYKNKYAEQVYFILKENFKNPWYIETINASNPFSRKLVALYEEKIVGFLNGEIILDEGNILMISVKKEFQNKGVGRKLMNRFEKLAKKEGVKAIYLEVSEKNINAIDFYKKLGFIPVGQRKNYYKNGENALLLKKEVK